MYVVRGLVVQVGENGIIQRLLLEPGDVGQPGLALPDLVDHFDGKQMSKLDSAGGAALLAGRLQLLELAELVVVPLTLELVDQAVDLLPGALRQAVCFLGLRDFWRSSIWRIIFSMSIRVLVSRWMQYVHFSMTPRLRTVTSGLCWRLNCGSLPFIQLKKLNRRTLYGQLFEQYRVPTQRLYTMSLTPSGLCTVAPTGQTTSQGAFSQCMQGTGWW